MKKSRSIRTVTASQPTIEGAGVHLKRAFGFQNAAAFDPFLLLDDFRSDNPAHFSAGFPWHPHRGIETITYMLEGSVEHGDSMANSGVIGPGDVQWMTAGSGIIHQEMPKADQAGRMGGFQLWANLPALHKMMDPRYREVKLGQIPRITTATGVNISIICGEVAGSSGPVRDVVIDPEYLDITVPARTEHLHPTKPGHTVLVYVIDGRAIFGQQENRTITNAHLVVFNDGDHLIVTTEDHPARFLLISGRPLHEPIAWYGPIVMNTQEELRVAFEEYRNGTFIKSVRA